MHSIRPGTLRFGVHQRERRKKTFLSEKWKRTPSLTCAKLMITARTMANFSDPGRFLLLKLENEHEKMGTRPCIFSSEIEHVALSRKRVAGRIECTRKLRFMHFVLLAPGAVTRNGGGPSVGHRVQIWETSGFSGSWWTHFGLAKFEFVSVKLLKSGQYRCALSGPFNRPEP